MSQAPSLETLTSPVPSLFATYTSQFPSRLLIQATLLPSALREGTWSNSLWFETFTSPVPSVFATYTS